VEVHLPLTELRRSPLVEQAIERLREQITTGAWPVGTRLPSEATLAAELGVGRSTIREAIRALASTGMVESRQGAGTFVRAAAAAEGSLETRLRRAALLDVYEVRHALELQAARLAATRRDADDLARLQSTLDRRQAALAVAKDATFVEADLGFHQAVVDAAHNPILTELFASFTSALREAMFDIFADRELQLDATPAHLDLAAAIRAGDPEAASAATSAHLDATIRTLKALLDQPGQGAR
jgi:GntR family transcriptional regulator, transcriptional repressor for pyruvate dehydrogenase complex